MNPNLTRWVYTSIVKHFKTALTGLQVVLDNEDLASYDKAKDIFELRVEGPRITEGSNQTILRYRVNFLLKTRKTDSDQYLVQRRQGQFHEAFTDICVKRYGDGVGDDSSLVGTLQIENPIETHTFLSVANVDVGTVEAPYKLVL
jgi:hypothetical protein